MSANNPEYDARLENELALIDQARTFLNEAAGRLLLASKGNTSAAQAAAKALVAGLLRATNSIHEEIEIGNSSLKNELASSAKWPVTHYPFPEDRRLLAERLAELGYSTHCPLNTKAKKHWGRGPATQWALQFWEVVQQHKNDPVCIALGTVPTRLPPLTTETANLNAWHKHACKYFCALSPKGNLAFHKDWKNRSAKEAKIRAELKTALQRIAARQETSEPTSGAKLDT